MLFDTLQWSLSDMKYEYENRSNVTASDEWMAWERVGDCRFSLFVRSADGWIDWAHSNHYDISSWFWLSIITLVPWLTNNQDSTVPTITFFSSMIPFFYSFLSVGGWRPGVYVRYSAVIIILKISACTTFLAFKIVGDCIAMRYGMVHNCTVATAAIATTKRQWS